MQILTTLTRFFLYQVTIFLRTGQHSVTKNVHGPHAARVEPLNARSGKGVFHKPLVGLELRSERIVKQPHRSISARDLKTRRPKCVEE